MENRVTINICGEEYTLVAEENPAYIQRVAKMVDEKMSELATSAKLGRNDAAVLTAVNLADELIKAQEAAENLRMSLKSYLDEANRAKTEVSELKRELFRAQQNNK